eukprot:7702888-Lingulodinium_polyedra.AAC.1
MAYVGKGLRAPALRTRLRAWRGLRRWLEQARGTLWPRGTDDVLEYLEARASEQCGRTCLRAALAGLRFMVDVGQQ